MNDELKKEEVREERKEKGKVQNQFRLVVGKLESESLDEMVGVVNEGFSAGEVSRTDLVGYLLLNAKRLLSKAEIAKIRDQFFDERKALDNLMRDSEIEGRFPEELSKILKERFRLNAQDKKASG